MRGNWWLVACALLLFAGLVALSAWANVQPKGTRFPLAVACQGEAVGRGCK